MHISVNTDAACMHYVCAHHMRVYNCVWCVCASVCKCSVWVCSTTSWFHFHAIYMDVSVPVVVVTRLRTWISCTVCISYDTSFYFSLLQFSCHIFVFSFSIQQLRTWYELFSNWNHSINNLQWAFAMTYCSKQTTLLVSLL